MGGWNILQVSINTSPEATDSRGKAYHRIWFINENKKTPISTYPEIFADKTWLLSNESRDVNTANVCKEIIATGTYANLSKTLPIDNSTFLLDILKIGKRKYTNFRRICKSENITFPSYSRLAQYRNDVNLVNELTFVTNSMNVTIGIAISYRKI